LGIGETLTITYEAMIESGIADGQQLANTAAVTEYSSMAGVDTNERVNGPESDGATVRANGPALVTEIQIIGDDTLQVGDTVTYRYLVRNIGRGTAYNVDVDGVLPDGLSYVPGTTNATWDSGSSTDDPSGTGPDYNWNLSANLDSNDLLILEFEAVVDADASTGTYETTLSSSGVDRNGDPIPLDPPNPSDTDDDDQDMAALQVTNPAVLIDKRLAGGQDNFVQVGEAVGYEIEITNTGDTVIDVLPLQDDYDSSFLTYVNSNPASDDNNNDGIINWADLTTTEGDLGVGSSVTVSVNFTANAEGTSVANTGTLAGVIDENSDSVADVTDTDTSLSITNPSVAIEKTLAAGQDPIVALGGTVSYTVTITNDGDTTIDVLPLSDTYDTGFLEYQSSSIASDDNDDDGTINWSDLTTTEGDLAPGGSVSVDLTFVVESTGGTVNLTEVASATDVNSDIAPTVSDDDASLTITNPNLELEKALVAGQDTIVPVGGTVAYDITVTNIGDTILTSVPLEETYDTGVLSFTGVEPGTPDPDDGTDDGQIDWTDLTDVLGDLGVGDSWTLTLNFTVVGPSDPTLNTVRIENAVDENDDNPPVIQDTDNGLLATDPAVTIDKSLSVGQDEFVQIGDLVSFTITVENTGTTVIEEVALSDTYDPTYLTFESASIDPDDQIDDGTLNGTDSTGAGTLEVGETMTVVVNFRAAAIMSAVENTAEVPEGTDENSDEVPTVNSIGTVSVTEPSLSVEKTLANEEDEVVELGQEVPYVLTVTNDGDTVFETIPLVDDYPEEYFAYASSSIEPESTADGVVRWADITGDGSLNPGESIEVIITLRTIQGGNEVPNMVYIEGAIDENGDTLEEDDETTESTYNGIAVFARSDVTLTKTADPVSGSIMLPDEIITFTVEYANTGDVIFPNTVLTDHVNSGLEYVAGSLTHNGTTLTDDDDADEGRYEAANQDLVVEVGDLGPGDTGFFSFQARIRDLEYSRQGVVNVAIMDNDLFQGYESNQTIHYVDPIDLYKSAEDLNGGNLEPGDRVRWTLTVSNVGISETTSVVVTDPLPSEVTYEAGSIVGRGADDSDSRTMRWDIGTMEIGEILTLSFVTTVNAGVPNGAEIANQAMVTSDQSNPEYSDYPVVSGDGVRQRKLKR